MSRKGSERTTTLRKMLRAINSFVASKLVNKVVMTIMTLNRRKVDVEYEGKICVFSVLHVLLLTITV